MRQKDTEEETEVGEEKPDEDQLKSDTTDPEEVSETPALGENHGEVLEAPVSVEEPAEENSTGLDSANTTEEQTEIEAKEPMADTEEQDE